MKNHEWDENHICVNCKSDFYTLSNIHCSAVPYGQETLKKCECGSEIAGFVTHVHWCPKYEKKEL